MTISMGSMPFKKSILHPETQQEKLKMKIVCVCVFSFFVGGFVSTKKQQNNEKSMCPCADLGTDTSHTGVASWTNWFTSFQAVPCIFLQGKADIVFLICRAVYYIIYITYIILIRYIGVSDMNIKKNQRNLFCPFPVRS